MASRRGTHLEGVLPAGAAYKTSKPVPKRKFDAWHKPRKQFVRENQWCASINDLLSRVRLDGRPLRYLSLPGTELLDIRWIHEQVSLPTNTRLRFLGFNTDGASDGPAQVELEISMDEVRRLPNIDNASKVLPDDFRSLSTDSSTSWNHAKDIGPFDVINVDLCGTFGREHPGRIDDSYYNAIQNIITLQATNGTEWMLFLTTRVGADYQHRDTIHRLMTCISQNFDSCRAFVDAASTWLKLKGADELSVALRDPRRFHDLYLVGLGKWLCGLALAAAPQWEVRMRSICNYQVLKRNPAPDMLSLVFQFRPIVRVPQDRHRIAAERNLPPAITECDLAMAVVHSLEMVVNVDRVLRANRQTATEQLIARAAGLMAQARYDRDEYVKWARRNI